MKNLGLALFIVICLTLGVLLVTHVISVIVSSALFAVSLVLFVRFFKKKEKNT